MPRATALVAAPALRPPVRLRSLLAVALLVGTGSWVLPRAQAAWQLHHLASSYADYAACMVGPTGPGHLRDNPTEFARLVVRRVVSSRPSDTPFRGCIKLAESRGADLATLKAHTLAAEQFVEYGGSAADRAARGELAHFTSELAVSTETLAGLAGRAWPFVRTGYTRLVKPSSHAKEAIHPVPAPDPGIGSGLPARRTGHRATAVRAGVWIAGFGSGANLSAFRSVDRGITWQPAGPGEATDFADGCPADGEGRFFSFSVDGETGRTVVISLGPDSVPYAADLAGDDQRILAAACDGRALVVVLHPAAVSAGSSPVRLELCPYRKPCTKMTPPAFGERGLVFPVDVARLDGTTVLASTAHGITRVSSSRDDGRSWTPPAVVFDQESGHREGLEMPAPFRLLAVDNHVLLYGGGRKPDDAYWLLRSDDHGASFHAP